MTAAERACWVVAVDGGGSKIAVAAQPYTADSSAPESLESARLWTFPYCGSAHPSSWNAARQHLSDALNEVCRELKLADAGRPVRHLLFALAGAGRDADRSRVLDWARNLHAPFGSSSIICVSDIEPIIDFQRGSLPQEGERAGGAEPAASVAVILGTGSIVATRDRSGRVVRAGGWGPQLGDECSGGALGIAALRSVAEWLDAGSKIDMASPLVAGVLSALPGRDRWLAAAGEKGLAGDGRLAPDVEVDRDKLASVLIETAAVRSSAAALAHVVLEQAFEKREPAAVSLIEPHLERLSWQIEQVVRRARPGSVEFQLVFSGGLVAHCPGLRQAVLDACRARQLRPLGSVVAEPLLAALRLAVVRAPASAGGR
jgi:N-acetylglucosamine kinase-like BadF-type ATPase